MFSLQHQNKTKKNMNIAELEKLSEKEMSQIRGGTGQWVFIDNQWIWVEDYNLEDNPPPLPPTDK